MPKLESKTNIINVVQFNGLSVSGATPVGTNNDWVAVKTNGDYVTITASFCPNDTNAAALLHWRGGTPAPGNPLQVTVPKASSGVIKVTASCCNTSVAVKVWIIWSTISIQTSGSNPSALIFNTDKDYWVGNQLGIQYGANSHLVAGKVCVTAQITPAGVNSIVTNGWFIWQNMMDHEFAASTNYIYFDTWLPDATDSNGATNHEATIPDNNDRIYYIDGPAVNEDITNHFHSYEMNDNFNNWVTWNRQICSDTTNNANNFWHWQEWWNASRTPWVTFTNLGTGTIDLKLYTNSAY